MKGVVFTEFLDLVEDGFGMPVADRVLTKTCPIHQGFTSVGYYDYHDLLKMVGHLSEETGVEPRTLVHAFGKHMFQSFLTSNPEDFESVSGTFELLKRVEDVIHVEVLKIHADAELPKFSFPPAPENSLRMVYESKRPFADLAAGLIEASIEHFKEALVVERQDLEGEPGTRAEFLIKPCHA